MRVRQSKASASSKPAPEAEPIAEAREFPEACSVAKACSISDPGSISKGRCRADNRDRARWSTCLLLYASSHRFVDLPHE